MDDGRELRYPGEAPHRAGREVLAFSAIASVLLAWLFRDALLRGYVLGQADFLLELAPWNETKPIGLRPNNRLLGDIPVLIYPFLFHAKAAVWNGEFPLWASGIGAGHPFLASFQSAVLSPFTLLDYLLPFPAGFTADVAARLFAGGLGMFLFLRRMPVGFVPALFGGIAYLLNPFSIVWLEHPLSAVAACLPWLLLTIDLYVQRRDTRSASAIAVVTAAALLAGHPETAFKVALFAGVYAVDRAGLSARGLATVAGAAAAMALGVLVASAQLLPFLEYLSESRILAFRETLTQPVVHTRPLVLVTAFVPDFYGTPLRNRYLLYGTNYCEQQLYPGIVTFVLASLAVASTVHRSRVRFFVAAAVVSLLVMFVPPIATAVVALIPPLKVAILSRFNLIAITSLIIVAAIGAEELCRSNGARIRSWRQVAIALAAAAALGAIVAGFLWGQHGRLTEARLWAFTLRSTAWTVQLLAAAVAIVWIGSRVHRRGAALLAVALIAVDLLVFADGFHGLIPRHLAFPPVPSLQAPLADPEVFRVSGWSNTLLPNTTLVYGLQDFRSYDGIGVRRYSDLLDVGFFYNGSSHQMVNTATPNLIDLLNIKYVLAPDDIDLPLDRFDLVREGPTRVYRNRFVRPRAFLVDSVKAMDGDDARRAIRSSLDVATTAIVPEIAPDLAPQRADGPVGKADIVRYADHVVAIRTSAAGRRLLVLSDVFYPGWIATVDGVEAPIHRANFAFRGVSVPAGDHVVEFRYRPASFRLGLGLSGLGIGAAGWLALRGRRRLDQRAVSTGAPAS